MTATFGAKEVNDTLRVVKAMSDDSDIQLSILTRALVVACKSCEVECERTVEIIREVFAEETVLIPLEADTH